ncbi:MAG: zinc ribbon domain-containing protein [Clostridiales bacterium]|nr:zinc ribbon domain-containing protein [Clostridiales bacterium]
MALIKCPECGKQISDKANACPQCGCPIANRPTSIKIRCLSTDRTVKYLIFKSNGMELARGVIGSTVTININKPTRITVQQKYALLTSGDTGSFMAEPGKCYEAKFCKPGLAFYQTIISEVSFIS